MKCDDVERLHDAKIHSGAFPSAHARVNPVSARYEAPFTAATSHICGRYFHRVPMNASFTSLHRMQMPVNDMNFDAEDGHDAEHGRLPACVCPCIYVCSTQIWPIALIAISRPFLPFLSHLVVFIHESNSK